MKGFLFEGPKMRIISYSMEINLLTTYAILSPIMTNGIIGGMEITHSLPHYKNVMPTFRFTLGNWTP